MSHELSQREALLAEIQGLYAFERDLVNALAVLVDDIDIDTLDVAGTAGESREELQSAVAHHREETETHAERLADGLEGDLSDDAASAEVAGWVDDKEQFNNIVLNDVLRPCYYLQMGKRLEAIECARYDVALMLAREDDDVDPALTEALEANHAEEIQMLERLAGQDALMLAGVDGRPTLDPANRSALYREGVNIETIADLFLSQLQNHYYHERHAQALFEDMATNVEYEELEEIISASADVHEQQIDRLEAVFGGIGPRALTSRSHTYDGIVRARQDDLSGGEAGVDPVELRTALALDRMSRRGYLDLLTLAEPLRFADETIGSLQTAADEADATLDRYTSLGIEDIP